MITIVRVNTPRRGNVERVPVCRPHALGNPFYLRDESLRSNVIERYREWFMASLHKPMVQDAIRNIVEILAADGEVELACYCAPRPCHAEVIKEHIEANYPMLFNEEGRTA